MPIVSRRWTSLDTPGARRGDTLGEDYIYRAFEDELHERKTILRRVVSFTLDGSSVGQYPENPHKIAHSRKGVPKRTGSLNGVRISHKLLRSCTTSSTWAARLARALCGVNLSSSISTIAGVEEHIPEGLQRR